MNLATAFERSVEQHSSKPALFWGETELTHGQIRNQAARVQDLLSNRLQLQPGERVGLWLKNCPEFVSCLFGTWLAQGIVVPINNFLKAQEVEFILHDGGIQVLLSEEGLKPAFKELEAKIPGLRIVTIEELKALPETASTPGLVPQTENDLAVIVYTSGTTGHPKGAMLSHGNLLHNVESCRQMLQAVSFDRFVVILPMFHSFMLTVGVLLPILVGGSLVLIKSLQSPKAILHDALARNATILPAIPQFFRALASTSLPEQMSLRLCVSGAAPLPQEVLKEFNARFPIPLLEGYGLSEASPVVSMNPIKGPWKAGSIGIPVPGVEMSVQDDAGRHLGAREVGEICVRGGNVMQGYWKRPEESAKVLKGGWLLTGDVGFRDEEGYYYITDRKKDMLLVNGINVYPREVEEVIYAFPGVKEVAVIGIPDARKGEQPLAFVAAKEEVHLDERALLEFVKERLADYKVPRRVVFLDHLPRNATGKILKTALRGMA